MKASTLYNPLLAIAVSSLLLTSCSAGKQAASSAAITAKGAPYCINVAMEGKAPLVGWYKSKAKPTELIASFSLPSSYDVYEVDSVALAAFFSYATAHQQKLSFNAPLSSSLGCQPFVVADAGTMEKGLAVNYPDHASLKGNSPNNTGADIRLNYGNGQMNASIVWDGSTYLIAPVTAGGHTLYIVYDKANSTEKGPSRRLGGVQSIPEMQNGLQTTDR